MKNIIIFTILLFLFGALVYIDQGSLFLSNVAGIACSKLKPGENLNFAIALINRELALKRDKFI